MRVYYGEWASGKTVNLIKLSEETNTPILVANKTECDRILRQAKMQNAKIPNPISLNDVKTGKVKRLHIDSCLIDEFEFVLSTMLNGMTVNAVTLSKERTSILKCKRTNFSNWEVKEIENETDD